ncbi:Cationic peroxidase 1 [Sesamum angolense]|uniref:Peroxidase n=1 Tax=Sesamum angolense TaxID=2727404 RepID=A0AAE2BSK2_9LAMI|nr:Cationic peroxidase 1 [Sesamum angolense]
MATATHLSNISARLMLVLLVLGIGANAQLSSNFYSSTCPNLLSIIKTAVDSAVSSDARMGASLLRLHFHDCFVLGCDASVLLDDTANFTGEKTAGPNVNSLRGFDVIDTIKTQVERSCPGIVSCADILSVAARDGVVALNGPSWAVALGRRDFGASTPSLLPSLTKASQPEKWLLFLARCTVFRNRIYNEANINASFAASVRANCPQSGGDNNLSPLDVASPNVFNNDYFRNLLSLRGLLHSDQQLFNNGSTDAQVRAYSTNSAAFFNDFASAMVKMSNLSPLTGTNGQIRRNCRRTN